MQLGSIGVPEMLVIVLVVLLAFGPRRLPEVARGLARAAGEFRQGLEHGIEHGLEPSAEEQAAAASWGSDARPHAAGGGGAGEGTVLTTAAPPAPTGEEQPGR